MNFPVWLLTGVAVSALVPPGAAEPALSPTAWTLHETARDNGRRLARIEATFTPFPAGAAVISVDPGQRFQTMVGFGGALTESSAWVLAQLGEAGRAEVLRRYFDPVAGIGYTLARTHINSCDFSLGSWALAETPGDVELKDFTLAPMRRWVLPLIHEARAAAGGDTLRLMASPWSPPAWMKTNGRMAGGGSLRPEYRAAWARYYVRFVEAMRREEKIPVWALTVQNEPEAVQSWESCLYTPEEERDFVRDHLGPALAAAGMADVRLLGWDHNRDGIERRADALFGDPEASRYLWGVALHWYISEDYAASSRVRAKYPDKPILFTEGCWEAGAALGAWRHGEGYARQMMGDFRNGVSGWIDWNIVLDARGGPNHVGNFCDAPVIVDTATGEVRYQSGFYYIGHFSRFVRVGAERIASEGAPAGLNAMAFRNPDGGVVVVVLNETDDPVTFGLAVVGESNRGCRIPAHGIQTYMIGR
ncbi:MAG TPA: glycoside hydrolase family 30 protein [Opitutaceae bacterium]|jgi:glucosylceramidase|nr:glycoside hydrolase family 30 protein [Opitutaceae bacterium]